MANYIVMQRNFLDRLCRDYDQVKDNLSNTTIHYINAIIIDIDQEFLAAKDRHNKIEVSKSAEVTKYIEDDVYQSIRTKYYKLWSYLQQSLPETSSTRLGDTNLNSTRIPIRPTRELTLKKIDLPPYSGSYEEWMSFINLFNSIVHNNDAYDPIDKLHYLRTSLKGEAFNVIKNLKLNEENYSIALKRLKSRFQHTRRLVNSYFKRLFKAPAVVTDTSNSIKHVVDNIHDCNTSLKELNVEVPDYIIIYHTVDILPTETVKDWEHSLGSSIDLPTLDQFLTFLENRFRVLEMTESISKPAKKPQKMFHVQNVEPNRRESSSKAKQLKVSKPKQRFNYNVEKPECFFCKGEHLFFKCDEYSRMPVAARWDYVKRCKRCINCLSNAHLQSQCKSRYSCKVCKGKHHSTLHEYEVPNSHNQEVSSSVASNLCNMTAHQNFHVQSTSKLLGTARVKAENSTGVSLIVRALVDPCSTDNYITTATVKSLRLKKYYDPTEVLTMGQHESNQCPYRVNLHIRSMIGDFSTEISAAVIDQITTEMPSTDIPIKSFGHLADLPLGDPFFNRSYPINLLLGVDVHTLIKVDDTIKFGNLMAENTLFGYLIRGSASDDLPRQSRVMLTHNSSHDLRNQIQKFWETEELLTDKPKSSEEILCEEMFHASLKRNSDGRLNVKLPFKQNTEPVIGQSRFSAVRRFLTLERKLENSPELKKEYHKQIQDYIDANHLVKATNSTEPGKQFYLPHHSVIKETSSTTKVRIVYDASCKSSDGTSLNDHLMTGPKLQSDIRDILFAWRQFPIPLTADIEKMYRMFGVEPIHQDYQRIVWRFSPTEPLEDWKLTTITFGTSSAPYQAIRMLNYIADECQQTFPLASKTIKSNFYVDDCIAGEYSIQGTIELKTQLLEVLRGYGLNLRKWNSSCQQVLDEISPELRDQSSQLMFDETEFSKTLGVCWSKLQDSFHFNIDLSKYSVNRFTKREVLSLIARLYDPLGFVSPCTMLSKQVMQRIWQTKGGWDEQVDEPICKDFSNFLNELHLLRHVKIPRWINLVDATSDVTIFGFCDASTKGYGAVIYLLNPMESDSNHKLLLLASKTKVADLKYESIARLELRGAVLLAELIHWVVDQFRPRNSKVFAFCDSQIVLAWLQSNPAKWTTFVANRTTQILNLTSKEDWFYVDTKNNPADFASRGLLPSEIIHNDMWWYGPDLNNLHFSKDIKLTPEEETIVSETVNRKSIVLQTRHDEPSFITKYSCQFTMTCKARYLTQFPRKILQKLLSKLNNSSTVSNVSSIISKDSSSSTVIAATANAVNSLNTDDQGNQSHAMHIQSSSTADNVILSKISRYSEVLLRLRNPENIIFRTMQRHTFGDEIKSLASNQRPPKKSKLKGLFPFLDKNGVLRVGGRLQKSDLSYSQKHPIILANKHQVTKNIILDAHERTLHGSESLTLSYLRNRYHIPRATEAVKNVIHQCNTCFRYARHQQNQLMGSLPLPRVNIDRAFQNAGVDYAGPIMVKAYRGRCQKFIKHYIAVFVCLGSKALHLELVSDLSSKTFLAAFQRFTSSRGRCYNLYSDNGTNFVGAAKILAEETRKAEKIWKNDLEVDFKRMGTKWHFIPPATPHFGGLWEAGVKSIKTHLKKIIGTSTLTYEELLTVLKQIEGVLNSRPLCPMSNNPNDYNVLTPAHFLIFEPIIAPIENIDVAKTKPPVERWNHIQHTFQKFANLWKRDYLQTLQNRPKNQFETNEFAVNDLVLLADDDISPTLWPTVIVDQLHPGKDGLVRVITVRTSKGKSFKRHITKLRKLPCNNASS